jgi:hypothetical protein
MQRSILSFLIFCLALIFAGCASHKSATTAQGGKYSEDLSIWHPKVVEPVASGTTEPDKRKESVYVEPKYDVNKQLDVVLDSIDRYTLSRNYIEGFTIQIYTGLKREEALNAKKLLTSSLPDMEAEIQYAQPNFRVKVGKYFTRLDAQQHYMDVKDYFPTAIIVPDKIVLK